MRLWSVHPCYLDAKGLVALWREGLLARKVLLGGTKGYVQHPQLKRFKSGKNPVRAIDAYLKGVWIEAQDRGYTFDGKKIRPVRGVMSLPVTSGQVKFEGQHLLAKLKLRDKKKFRALRREAVLRVHPLFRIVEGEVEGWEKGTGPDSGAKDNL